MNRNTLAWIELGWLYTFLSMFLFDAVAHYGPTGLPDYNVSHMAVIIISTVFVLWTGSNCWKLNAEYLRESKCQ